MSSVSLQRDESGLCILFNRDERRTRSEALPPAITELKGRQILRPVDSDKGGTWFAVNQFGLAVGLLNNYQLESRTPENARSRGELVMEIATSANLEEAEAALHFALDRDPYPAFSLLVWHGDEVKKWDWAVEKLSFTPRPEPLITSSSWETERVETWRKFFYDEKVKSGEWDAVKFHRHVIPGDEASSVCMSRDTSRTVSLTICRITDSESRLTYYPRSLDGSFQSGETVVLPTNLLL